MMIALRAFLIGILRFVLVIALIIFSQKFEVSPLPAWTLGAFVYFCLFVLTYFTARWVFARRMPNTRSIVVCFLLFILIETGSEVGFYLVSVRNAGLYDVTANFGVHTLLLYAMYFFAVWLAGFLLRRKKVQEQLPEGMAQ